MPARYRRRKEDRPAELTAAAMDEFAKNGYDATPVEAVAKRAGVSKGLLYVYFRTKEELFKAVVRSVVSPRLDKLTAAVADEKMTVAEFLRGPFLTQARALPRSKARYIFRLMIAEGHKHPDLTRWYWDHVVSKAFGALRTLIARGVQRGELKPNALEEFPQLLMSPVLLSVVWTLVLAPHAELDTDKLLESHVELLLAAILKEDP